MDLNIELLKEMVAALPDPVFILTESGRYAGLTGGIDRHYYRDGSSLVGSSLYDVLPREKADWFLAQIRQTLQEQSLRTVEYSLADTDIAGLHNKNGPRGEVWFEGRIQPLSSKYEGERAVVWVARNITRQHDLEIELRHSSETDFLTGVFNRRKFLSELKDLYREFLRYDLPAALIILDIDGFKDINDRYGHLVGDELLQNITRSCETVLREVDLLFRFGGDEFAILLPNTVMAGGILTAERLRLVVAKKLFCQAEDVFSVTLSIGISGFSVTDSGEEDVIRRADNALYEAKRTGRNRVVSREIL